MTDRELRRLSRKELLEMLIRQEGENEKLKQALSEAEEKVKSREINISEAGTVADAAFALNKVYEAADAAAKQYLENVKCNYYEQQPEYQRIVQEAELKAAEILKNAETEKEKIIREAEEYIQQSAGKSQPFNQLQQMFKKFLNALFGKRQK